jgi:microcystin-dependent protein
MSDFFLGEIRIFSFEFAPDCWAKCNGTSMNRQQNAALFSLLAEVYGKGDGKTTFGLPDLRGRVPLHWGGSKSGRVYDFGVPVGGMEGVESVTLTQAQALHSHPFYATTTDGTAGQPAGGLLAAPPATSGVQHPIYGTPPNNLTAMNPGSISTVGRSGSHDNMQPFLVINFCIATSGVYPPRP